MSNVFRSRYFNTHRQQFDDFTVESGSFGHKVYPGCGQVRNGMLKFLRDPAYMKAH